VAYCSSNSAQASTTYCWGFNNNGGLGDGTVTQRLTPVAVAGGLHFGSVNTSVNGRSTCGVTTGDRAYCWGNNFHGQLGDGSIDDRYVPVPVLGP
jgi:alpha-tubulin suppressor-like RCC1 family protein